MPLRLHLAALLALTLCSPASATDWPFWRYDAARSGNSPAELPNQLYLQWARDYPELETAWPDQPKMQFDAAYEPIVVGKTLYVASAMTDSVTAIDTDTGNERWRFHTDGPVRFAPLVWEAKLYCSADDGYLYCLDAPTGKLIWKFRGGPADRRVLGNERLISSWPARGAPVIADGTVYFAASIWPFMGVFIHALDARTGAVVWTTDGDGAMYMKQPHSADSFAGVAPQGPLAVAGDMLLVPGGRSVPACYDRKTGKFIRYVLAENGKRGGGSEVVAAGKFFFNGGAVFETATQKWCADVGQQVVAAGDVAYAHNKGKVSVLDLKTAGPRTTQNLDKKGAIVKTSKWVVDSLAECKSPVVLASLIKAGPRLYGAGGKKIVAIEFPEPLAAGSVGQVAWQADIEGTAARLVAADGKLFAVTLEGRIYCFGGDRGEPKITHVPLPPPAVNNGPWADRARRLLEDTKVRDGYAVAWGVGSGELIRQLVRQSSLHVVVVEQDARKAAQFKDAMIAAGLYGRRVAVHHGDYLTISLPPYFANLMVAEQLDAGTTFAKRAFQNLRPFGGVAAFPLPLHQAQKLAALAYSGELPGAKVGISAGTTYLTRVGALPGSANWTHEHADASNTRVGKDSLVKAPLGILWWGGPEHHEILPRHGHGPQPQVIDGRLIIEGMDLMRCMDIYTGRILWETRLPGVGYFFNNLAHQPGANASGTNYISTSDGIYVVHGRRCVRLDPATGKIVSEFRLPALPDSTESPVWGYLNVVDDYLIAGADPLYDPKSFKPILDVKLSDDDDKERAKAAEEKKAEEKKAAEAKDPKATAISRGAGDNMSGSKRLVVMDRHTGQVLWTTTARNWFRHNATCVGNGRLYTIDRLSGVQLDRFKRLGEKPPHPARLLAFDLKTGNPVWSTEDDVFGTWLSYSTKHDVLVESGRNASDTLTDEAKGMRAYRAADGDVIWFNKSHLGPAMIHGDTILKQQSACDLLTGKPKMRLDPVTGQLVEWKWVRNYGCNTPAASEHLLTFRSGAAGFFDLCNDGGTGNFGGFKSGCTNNLIVAGGILNAPDYTRTCTCSYQNQTSLALIHMPEAEMWTSFGPAPVRDTVRRVGLNFGAPGDRKDNDGTLWLEFPNVGGPSPAVTARLTGTTLQYYRRHSSQMEGPLPWVGASGVKGLSALTISRGADPVVLHAAETLCQALATMPVGQTFVPGGLGQIGLSPYPPPTKPKKPETERVYTIRLYFSEPDAVKPGQRVFNVGVQGKTVLTNFDVIREAGGGNRTVVKEFKGVKVGKELNVTFAPTSGATVKTPLISGIEILAEGW